MGHAHRARRRRWAAATEAAPARRSERVEQTPAGEFYVRPVAGSAATKAYRCPGCEQSIGPGVPHVVAWPVRAALLSGGSADGVAERRHWHTACWRAHRRPGPR